jgi:hypothetical protein
VLNAWTRFDEVRGDTSGVQPLAYHLNSGALGTQHLPSLAPAEAALRTLTGDANISLSLGTLAATADSRVVITPIMLEYGLTSRLAVGLMVPVVQTRTTLFVELNHDTAASRVGNVGPNPASLSAAALQQNTDFVQALDAARASLTTALASCQANPTGSVCSRQAEAQSLLQTSAEYAQAIAALYGIQGSAVSAVAPSGTLQTQIVARLAALDQQYESLLGSSVDFPAPPRSATAPAALGQLQQLVTGPFVGMDSLTTTERIGIGDIELSAAFQLVDQLRDSARTRAGGLRFRAALQGVVRLPTGRPARGTRALDVGTGTGQTSADARGVMDVRLRSRLMTTLVGQYTAYLNGAAVDHVANSDFAVTPFLPRTPGTWHAGNTLQVEATPRYLLTDFFTVNAHYALRRQAASRYDVSPSTDPAAIVPSPVFHATVEQRAGFGFGYSTLAGYSRGRSSIPIELIFAHLQTIGASGAPTPSYSREQIELRFYYRLKRSGR